jgi:sialic acid synthase SpsE
MEGPDHSASIEPNDLEALVKGVRKVECALGSGIKKPVRQEADTARAVRKSIVAACNIKKGSVLTKEMLVMRRPGTGLSADQMKNIIGKNIKQALKEGELLTQNMFS